MTEFDHVLRSMWLRHPLWMARVKLAPAITDAVRDALALGYFLSVVRAPHDFSYTPMPAEDPDV